jgi:multisubunit Na+/H+ antiporter MnhB subunit
MARYRTLFGQRLFNGLVWLVVGAGFAFYTGDALVEEVLRPRTGEVDPVTVTLLAFIALIGLVTAIAGVGRLLTLRATSTPETRMRGQRIQQLVLGSLGISMALLSLAAFWHFLSESPRDLTALAATLLLAVACGPVGAVLVLGAIRRPRTRSAPDDQRREGKA